MRVYLAVIHRSSGGEYRVQFPDFPGVEARAAELDELSNEAKRALSDEIQVRGGPSAELPRPTTGEALRLELASEEDFFVLPVPVD